MKPSVEARREVRKRRGQRFGVRLNSGMALLLALLFVGMVNYLSWRHHLRGDMTHTGYYSLSDKTVKLLSGLPGQIDVIVVFQRDQEIFQDIRNLLKEYDYLSPRIYVEFVDPHRDIARTKELRATYGLNTANAVIFDSGLQSKIVTEDKIYDYNYDQLKEGGGSVPIAFRGEETFTSAIQSITEADPSVVYTLTGHGEKSIEDYDRQKGYSSIARQIRRDNITLKPLDLIKAREIPADCAALIVAGPRQVFTQPELDLIGDYLDRNGRAVFLIDALTETGFEPLLVDWGIGLKADLVCDDAMTITDRELYVSDYGVHPITETLNGLTSIFFLLRSVTPLNEADGVSADRVDRPRVVALASTTDKGWAETNLDQHPRRFDPEEDRGGPVSFAVAAERGQVPGLDINIRPTRLAVFGDSDFLNNGALQGANANLFMNTLNWLIERPGSIAVAPRRIEQVRLVVDKRQLKSLFLLTVVGLPGAVILFGGLVGLVRRF